MSERSTTSCSSASWAIVPVLPAWVSDLGRFDCWCGAVGLMQTRGSSMVRACASDGETLLHAAARALKLDYVRLCLARGADVRVASRDTGGTPLHHVADFREPPHPPPGLEAAVTRALLDAGADPRAVDLAGETPLTYAARFGRHEVVRELFAHSARAGGEKLPAARDVPANSPESPLFIAVEYHNFNVVKALLENGFIPEESPTFRCLRSICLENGLDEIDTCLAAHGFTLS